MICFSVLGIAFVNSDFLKIAICGLESTNQQKMIVRAGYHPRAAVEFSLSHLRRVGYRSPPLASLFGGVRYFIERTLYRGVLAFERDPVAHGQIRWPYEQEINPFDGGNCVHAVHGFSILYLDHEKNFTVLRAQVLRRVTQAVLRICPGVIEPALSLGRKSGPLSPLPRLFRTATMRNHDAISTELQCPHGTRIPVLADPDHQVDSGSTACQGQTVNHFKTVSPVLHIEPNHVEAEFTHQLRKPWFGDTVDPNHSYEVSALQLVSQPALHTGLSSLYLALSAKALSGGFSISRDHNGVASLSQI
jgi:hypothetical protein